MMKKLLSLVLISILLITITLISLAKDLKDIENHWAKDAIKSMAENGIITGYPDGTFKPNETLTREQFAKLITTTFGLKQDNPIAPTFRDITKSRWSYSYIEACKEYLTGYFPPNGTPFFDPESYATREDVAVALVRAMDLKGNSDYNFILMQNFNDYEKISPNLREDVAVAYNNDLIKGFPDATFRPFEPVTRGQIATLLYRILKNSYTKANEEIEINFIGYDEITHQSYIDFLAETNADYVKINEKTADISNGSFMQWFDLKEFGEHQFVFTLKLGKKEKKVIKTVNYIPYKPTIEILGDIPQISYEPTIILQGVAKDEGDEDLLFTINNEPIMLSNKTFKVKGSLNEGVNIFELKAKNKDNQITVKQIKIEYIITPPELNIAYEKETDKNIQLITGNANDKNDISPKVFCNNEEVPTSKGSFNKILPLKEGINTFTFEAINSNNKKTTKTIEITYTPKPEYQLIYKGGQVTGYTGNPKNVVIPMSNNDIEITSIGAMAFQNCETLESISMPDTVIEMGSLVFQHCKNLKKVKLSNNIKVIPPQTFAYCENLQEINLGNAKTIKSEAFRGCINLNTITIPNTVALIEAHTFRECYRLTDVIFESDQAPKMGLYVFSYVEPMPTIHHPENSISYNTEWYNSFTN